MISKKCWQNQSQMVTYEQRLDNRASFLLGEIDNSVLFYPADDMHQPIFNVPDNKVILPLQKLTYL